MGDQPKVQPANAVLFHHPDAVETARSDLMGRHAAGEGFLHSFVRYSGVERFYCQGHEAVHGEDFGRRVAKLDQDGRERTFVPIGMMGRIPELPGTLSIPGPGIGMYAWRRRISANARSYSLCGVTHAVSSETVMENFGELLTAPVQPWDAVICASQSVKVMINRMLDNWGDYLERRSGGRFKLNVQLPIVPLGVECEHYQPSDEADLARVSVRRGLGIGDDDIAVLFFGRLSFHAKAHPMPMYLALEEAAKRTGTKFHLLQVGHFPNEGVEKEFREGVRRYSPSVNGIFLDGRDEAVKRQVWFAADIFCSFSDNIQESFGLTVIEAMAAGLPVVVSDWDGYKDTVRHGEDGFRIPTWLPLPDSGTDLAIQIESSLTPETKDRAYNHYCGFVSQATAVDVATAAEAFSALAIDPALRKRMGESGRERALSVYDWRVVIRTYQDLWQDLESRRTGSVENAPTVQGRPLHPLRDDPFSLFAGYPTHTVDGDAVVIAIEPDGEDAHKMESGRLAVRMNELRAQSMNNFAADVMLGDDEIAIVLEELETKGACTVIALAEPLAENVRFKLPRTLAWLAKIGLVNLSAPTQTSKAFNAEIAPPKTEAQALVDLGIRARSRGAIEAAGDYFSKALRADPNHAEANFHFGELQALGQQFDHAVEYLSRAVKAESSSIAARRSLGKVLFLKGDEKAAIKNLEEAVALSPEDAETHYLLGAGYRRAGSANNAVTHLERVMELDPNRADALSHLALARKSLGRRDAAMDAISKGLALDPNNVFALASMASLQAENKGRQLVAQSKSARRIAFHLNQVYQFPLLKPLFDAFSENHWPLISGDGRELLEFDPEIVVICDAQASALRRMVPGAALVNIGAGLAAKNFHRRVKDPGDFLCVSAPMVRDEIIERAGLTAERIWVIGYPPMDPLFKPEPLGLPFDPPLDRKTVLYAPTHNPGLTSALRLAEDPVGFLLGERTDINLIIKPHPRLCEQRPGLIEGWKTSINDREGVWLVTEASLDVAPFLKEADVLVTDASSVMFEYLALDRPVVLINPPSKGRDTTFLDDDGIEWKWRDLGTEVKDIEYLSDAVTEALENPDAKAETRARYAKQLFGKFNDGKATLRLVESIEGLKPKTRK